MCRGAFWYRLLGIAVFLLFWSELSLWTGARILVGPQDAFVHLGRIALTGEFWSNVTASVVRVLCGVGIGLTAAVAVSSPLLLGARMIPFIDGAISLARPIPPLAWIPVSVALFGIGNAPAIFIIALAAFFPIVLGILSSASQVPRQYLIAAAVFGHSRMSTLINVALPSMAIQIANGVRTAILLGWFCVVAAEMVGASSGLGYMAQISGLNLDFDALFAYMMAIGLVGIIIDRAYVRCARMVIHWAPDGSL
jgi:ABC-type nitrate/sulfonate/bicarbonate transport system permease component